MTLGKFVLHMRRKLVLAAKGLLTNISPDGESLAWGFTPSCHITVLRARPYTSIKGLRAEGRPVIAWAGASPTSGGPGRVSSQIAQPCKGVTCRSQFPEHFQTGKTIG